MTKQEKIQKIRELLIKEFPKVETPLIHNSAFQLLVATILSPQTLDTTTNKVTPELFRKYPTVYDLAKADVEEIQEIIKNVNYYRTKSSHLVQAAQMLIEKFGGEVPSDLNDLISLPGVGRKVANVIRNEWFGSIKPEGFVVDTHVKRVAYRLGLTKHTDPYKVEKDLMKVFDIDDWKDMSLRLIFHGRKTCKGQRPLCKSCPLRNVCPKVGVTTIKN